MAKHTIALIFDFDDTLVPDSTTALLASRGIDTEDFWKVKDKALIEKGWDPVHAYIKLFLDLTKPGEPFHGFKNKDFLEFGSTLELYSGLPEFFDQLSDWMYSKFSELDIEITYWVISGGFEEIIKGCTPISSKLKSFWGCRLASDKKDGPIKHITRTISFTEKTRYIFEINKGIKKNLSDKNPMLVNKEIPEEKRAIPFENMIYIGDGSTDIPCLSLIKSMNGAGIGIMHKDRINKISAAKRETFQDLISQKRAISYHYPDFTEDSELVSMIKTILSNRCSTIILREAAALD